MEVQLSMVGGGGAEGLRLSRNGNDNNFSGNHLYRETACLASDELITRSFLPKDRQFD